MFKKVLYLFIFLSLAIISCSFFESNYTYASKTYYAQITTNPVYFYSAPLDSEESKMFIIPITYFVELTSSADDTFYQARYNDIYGYVKKGEVKPVTTPPLNPFLTNINFRVFVPSGANLRTSPYNNGSINLIYSIPFLETNLSYYGITYGEESISKKGNVWYYCKYLVNNLSYTGYIYSPLCDELTPIANNTEIVEYLAEAPDFEDEILETGTNALEGMSQTMQTIIIIVVSLPCLLFIYLLFKPTRLAEEKVSNSSSAKKQRVKKNKYKQLRHSDYFELDDDF